MSNVSITAKTGTIWVNQVPDSEIYTAEVGWTLSTISAGTPTDVAGISCMGQVGPASTSTKNLTKALTAEIYDADRYFASAYVAKGSLDHCYLQANCLNTGFATQGGFQYFNLATGAVGSFVAAGAGALVETDIIPVSGGFYIYALFSCGGDDLRGSNYACGGADADASTAATGDGSTVMVYSGGLSFIDGPTGDAGYIATV